MRRGWRIALAILTIFTLTAARADEPAARIELDAETIAALKGDWILHERLVPAPTPAGEWNDGDSFALVFWGSGAALYEYDGVCIETWRDIVGASRQGDMVTIEGDDGYTWTIRLLEDHDRLEVTQNWGNGDTIRVYTRFKGSEPQGPIRLSDDTRYFLDRSPPRWSQFREVGDGDAVLKFDLGPDEAHVMRDGTSPVLHEAYRILAAREVGGGIELYIATWTFQSAGTLHLIRDGETIRVLEWNATFAHETDRPDDR